MRRRISHIIFFALTASIILACTAAIIYFSGFDHETEKVKTMLSTIIISLIFHMIIAEPIRFILVSIDSAFWPRNIIGERNMSPDDEVKRAPLSHLKQRLQALRVQMLITERHRNTTLNQEYKNIAQDLFLYAKYFLILTSMVLVGRNELLYYNTVKVCALLLNNQSNTIGLNSVYQLQQLFDFVGSSLVDSFDNVNDTGTSSWAHADQVKRLGVVRMRQLRLQTEKIGFADPIFSEKKFLPDWQPFNRMHYTDNYWRIYTPWITIAADYDFVDALLLNFNHVGKFQKYPELRGYVALLAQSKTNSMKILDFLTQYHWLTYNTSAVFLDFTLYNADANMFTVCTLRVEQTPFGSIIPDVDCDSVVLMEELQYRSYLAFLVLVLYIIVLFQFIQAYLVHVWFDKSKMNSMWFKLDLLIIVLNLIVISLLIAQAYLVAHLLKRLEGANKLDFVDFRRASRLDKLTTILIGFLICATTLRLWRVLQFSEVFQLFTKTLYLAWKALASTAVVILVILLAFGLALGIMNGNNSEHFARPVRGIITSVCFALGFSSELKPEVDLFYGGTILGIILYAAMGFIVATLLINVFMTILYHYFTVAREESNKQVARKITFFQFLRVEYYKIFDFFHSLPCFKRGYKKRNRTVAENIQAILDKKDRLAKMKARQANSLLSSGPYKIEALKTEETLQAEYRERIEHICAISTILNTQMEILEHMLFPDDHPHNAKPRKMRFYKGGHH